MADRKIVFFDIDGTLWDAHNQIPGSTIDAIRALRAAGHLAFINSGRCRSYIFAPHLLGVGFDGIVSGCGTMIEIDGLTRFYHRIPQELCVSTVEAVRRYGFRPVLEGRYNLYMGSDFDGDPFGEKLKAEMGERLLPINTHWGEWEISKISCGTEGADIAGCRAEIEDDFSFLIHNPAVIELVPRGFDKGTGVKKVCELLGADIADTVAFGDSPNDLEMLDAVAVGVVMGNGSDDAKARATYVTDDIHNDGIKKGLERLGLI